MAYTDHKPLCALLSSYRLNGRLRWLGMKLQHCLIQIEYLPGVENGLADALSREEQTCETGSNNRPQFGHGGCEGAPLTVEEEPMRET